jgi:2'-5' RNA ligase
MESSNGGGTRINSFALVSYLPEPLAEYLDKLRTELVKECRAKAHLTILPPRPLLCPAEDAWRQLMESMVDFQPFRVELGDIEVFPVTQVIYLSVAVGQVPLEHLHDNLNTGCLAFREPYEFHPHVTLAQELIPSTVPAAAQIAKQRWREFTGPRGFGVDHLTFVQNTLENRWTDLQECPLASRVAL